MMNLMGAYHPGTTWMHRLPAGAKLGGLALISVATVALGSWQSTAGFLIVAVILIQWSGAGILRTCANLKFLLIIFALLAAFQLWRNSVEVAFTTVGDLLALILLAIVLTTVTPVATMLDAVVRWCRPLRWVGANPEMIGLAFSLMIRSIPTTWELATETRHAAKARGLDRSPRAHLTPLVIRVVAHAQATGDALHARGIGDRD